MAVGPVPADDVLQVLFEREGRPRAAGDRIGSVEFSKVVWPAIFVQRLDAAMNELMALKTDLGAAQRSLMELGFRLGGEARPESGRGQFAIRQAAVFQLSGSGFEETEPAEGKGPRKLALAGAA